MTIIIKLQGLPLDAASFDVRLYFEGLTIPDGGVHIVGGDDGTVFVEFASDEDARQAMSRDGGKIKNSNIKLLLSSRTEMQSVTDAARSQKQQYMQQQELKFHLHQQQQQNHPNQLQHHHHLQQQQQQQLHQQQPQHNQQDLNQQPTYLTPTLPLMGPALIPTPTQQQQPAPFEGDPRMLSQNYQGMMNVMGQQPLSPKNQLQQQPAQNQIQQPSPFVDPRILSQSYQGMMPMGPAATVTQPMLAQQAQIFSPFPPTSMAPTNAPGLGLNLLGNMGLGGADLGLNTVVVGAGTLGPVGGIVNDGNIANAVNRNRSPDSRARMSGMRGGDDKLFANKRCVLAASNIPYRATSKDIMEFLSEFNIKEDCIRRRYNQKGQATADAKIAFPSPDAAMRALKMMNKKTLCGRPVFLKPV